MAQLIVRHLEDSVKAALHAQALLHGHSMEEEARIILRSAVARKKELPRKLGSWLAATFSGKGFTDEEIPDLRGQKARPAVLS